METRNVPDSILLTGNCERDMANAGFFLAKALNCQNANQKEPCLVCSACKKIQGHTHPDIIHIEVPEGKKDISIDQIRQMEIKVQVKPNEADWRMVMISQAGQMTTQAQNALLKVLEEPPPHTFFLLTAKSTRGLLSTILSRCRKIPFQSMGTKELAALLETQYSADRREAWIASRTAGADKQRAMQLLNIPAEDANGESSSLIDWKTRRKWLLDQMESLMLSSEPSGGQALIVARILSQAPEELSVWLMILGSFLRDMGIYREYPEGLIHRDRMSFFVRADRKIPRKRILGFLDLFHDMEKRLASNASSRLALERFCIGLSS